MHMIKTLALGTLAVLGFVATTFVGTLTYQTHNETFRDFSLAGHNSLVALVSGFAILGLLAFFIRDARRVAVCFIMLALAAFSFGTISASAQDLATSSGSQVTFNYGDFIMKYGVELAGYAITILAGIASVAVAKYAPWAASLATQKRLQMAGEALVQYGINAVPNSVRDGKVSVSVGSEVIAEAVAHGVNVLPSKVLKAAGGADGLAAVVFRNMNLEDGAGKANVLDPAIQKLESKGVVG